MGRRNRSSSRPGRRPCRRESNRAGALGSGSALESEAGNPPIWNWGAAGRRHRGRVWPESLWFPPESGYRRMTDPSLDRAFHGPDTRRGLEFSPNFKVSYDVTPKIAGGVEYYGALGPVTGFDPDRDQQQQ